jgi:Riboflavin synthase beta-chain
VDGVVTLGAVIKGQTKHDEVIANSTARNITKLAIKYQKRCNAVEYQVLE